MFAGALTTGFSHKTEIYTAPASDRFAGSHELFCAMHAGTYQLKKKALVLSLSGSVTVSTTTRIYT